MSGEHIEGPVHGVAAGVAYLALPPTAVDARPAGPTRMIVGWPGFDPPRSAVSLALALPLTGVPTWRVYLELPSDAPPDGLGSGSFLESRAMESYGTAVETAVARLPAVLDDLRSDLGVPDGPVGLTGFSTGAAAALLTVAAGTVPVSAAALVTPVVSPHRSARALENRSGRRRTWDRRATALAGRLDLGARARDVADRNVPLLLVAGSRDRIVPPGEVTALRDRLVRTGASATEAVTFPMDHALAAEPGTEARPPITEAVRLDAALTEWFRERFAAVTAPREPGRAALLVPQPRESTS
ncbi:Alpha/beta hydrolase family protein [Actinomadura rubteroloni]|uniref:Alpha/beta hydrolase family protein n=1 Tax=Actinomadura rubteroloni TaxID=1926885 RepID=A0A2P4ULQ5_9ACTN|nr:hypothetical protein [Actinomadura rubteroloni]POM25977.1 Alpha/beta hydrolase family protein [Actinomadura rubteroloni]